MQYFKAEIFRHSKIRIYIIFSVLLIFISLAINSLLRLVAPYQDFELTMFDSMYSLITVLLMGLYIVFPIITSAFSVKGNYIKEQLESSKISVNHIYAVDLIIALIICMLTYSLLVATHILSSRFMLDFTDKEFVFGKSNLSMWIVLIMIFIVIINSTIQAISLQNLLSNKVLSTGLFIFITYVVAIILLQMRSFSEIALYASYLFPMCTLSYLISGQIGFQIFLLLNIFIASFTVATIIITNKIRERRK